MTGRDSYAPIFILGFHRSGTTILYNALVAAGSFRYPTPYHLIHFDEHLRGNGFDPGAALARTQERFVQARIVDRFIDTIPAHPLSPEEYGFALPGGRITRATTRRFHEFCDFVGSTTALTGQPADGAGRLLLKNPRDLTRVRYLHEACPQAKFVFIHRHPGPVIESRMRELRLLFSQRSPYQAEIEPMYASIMEGWLRQRALRVCLRPDNLLALAFLLQFRPVATAFIRDIATLPPDAHVSTTYERLCARPEETIAEILAFLGLDERGAKVACDMLQPVKRPASRNAVLRSSAAVAWLRPYLDHCGYRALFGAEGET